MSNKVIPDSDTQIPPPRTVPGTYVFDEHLVNKRGSIKIRPGGRE